MSDNLISSSGLKLRISDELAKRSELNNLAKSSVVSQIIDSVVEPMADNINTTTMAINSVYTDLAAGAYLTANAYDFGVIRNIYSNVYLSDDEYQRQYEYDIIKEMSGQRKKNRLVAVSSHADAEIEGLVDTFINFDLDAPKDNIFLGFDYILVAQVIALFKSLSYKITPDNPCPTGEVNRVVKGVTIYPYTAK